MSNGASVDVMLSDLPHGHALRVAPLASIGAECRNKHSAQWREVRRWAIGAATFDELSGCWIECNEFRSPLEADHPGSRAVDNRGQAA